MTRAGLAPGEIGSPAYVDKGDKVLARVRYRRLDGTEARISRVGTSKSAARSAVMAAARERMTDSVDPGQTLTADSTIADLAATYIELQGERNLGSVEQYLSDERHVINRWVVDGDFGRTPLRRLRTSAIAAEHRRIGVTLGLVGRARQWITAVRKLLDLAVELDLISVNLARELKVRRPRSERGYTPDAATIWQLREVVLAYANRPDRAGPKPSPLLLDAIDVVAGTGLRLGEAMGLRWEDVDLDGETPAVCVRGTVVEGHGGRKHYQERPKSRESERDVPIPAYLAQTLRRRKESMLGRHTFVFETSTGKPVGMHQIRVQLWKVREWAARTPDVAAIDPGMAMHALRRAVGTVVTDGHDIVIAARVLGHAESSITEQHYRKKGRRAPDVRDTLQAFGRAPVASGQDAVEGSEDDSGPH